MGWIRAAGREGFALLADPAYLRIQESARKVGDVQSYITLPFMSILIRNETIFIA